MFPGYETGRVLKALVGRLLPPVLLFLVFSTLATLLLPNTSPMFWHFFGLVAVALYLGEKWKGNL